MQKPAPNDYPVHELISRALEPRAFRGQALFRKTVRRSIFEAARWAAFPAEMNSPAALSGGARG